MVPIQKIIETCLYVTDVPKAAEFYGSVLGLERIGDLGGPDRGASFRVGNGVLLLFNPALTVKGDTLPPHGANGQGHIAFGIETAQLDHWRKRIQDHGIAIEKEVSWDAGNKSIYFRDPSGNLLELLTPGSLWGLKSGY